MAIELAQRHLLLRTLSDSKSDATTRVQAASTLSDCGDDEVIDALVALAKNADEPADLQATAGRSLARICFRRARDLEEIIFAFMTEASAEAYDTEMGRLQREQPGVRIARGVVGSGR